MHRVTQYTGAIPRTIDVLSTNKYAMAGLAWLSQALLGSSTVVAGLIVAPTSPASLNVTVGVGSIYALDPTDASAYSLLGTDATMILKQGILDTAVSLAITPPGTVGYSQVYLVEVALQDLDAGSATLSFYNSANTAQPLAGPAGSGTPSYTIRQCNVAILLKAGTPATTGSQVAPTVDPGYVGLFTVTVANAQASITSTNITQLVTAPFFPTVPQIPYDVQGGKYEYAGTDTGAANAYVISFAAGQPIPTAYAAGMRVSFKASNANTGASTVNVNGLGAVAIYRASGVALAANDINSGQVVRLEHDGTRFQMVNYLGSGTNTNTSTTVDIPYIADSGTQNAIVATYSPAISSLTDGLYLSVKLANTITGGCTINVNGLGAKAVVLGDGSNPPYNVFVAGEIILLVYSTAMGKFQIANTSAGMFYKQPTGNYTIYVNTSTGSDSLYDGTSATVGSGTAGPFKTIGKAVTTAWSYAPSQYTITISVAAGTYNEAVTPPGYAGPNVIINGAGASSVTINATGTNNHCVTLSGPNTMSVQNLTVQTASSNYSGFAVSDSAVLSTANTASNAIAAAVFYAVNGGSLSIGSHTFNGSSTYLYWAINSGSLGFGGSSTQTFSTSISVSATIAAGQGGNAGAASPFQPSFVNPSYVSGAKYLASFNGIVTATGLGVNFYPGTVAGSTSTGGQYSA